MVIKDVLTILVSLHLFQSVDLLGLKNYERFSLLKVLAFASATSQKSSSKIVVNSNGFEPFRLFG